MTYRLSPWLRQQFFDGNGDPLAGGFVHFYVAGSGTLRKTTWQDYLGATENENPVELDSTGVAKIYGVGLYDVTIYDADGALIETVRGADFGGASSSGEGTSIIVDNYAALRALTQDYDLVYVLGRNTPDDGGQGWFQLSTSTDADDDGIILVRGVASRYKRVLSDYIDPRWYGVVYDTTVDQSASMAKAHGASAVWDLPVLYLGNVYLSSKTTVVSGARIIAHGIFHGPTGAPIELLFKTGSILVDGGLNTFGAGVKVTFEQSVTDALKLSWFTDGTDSSRWSKASSSSTYGYSLLADINTTCEGTISVPANFAVDFVGGSRIIASNLLNISIQNMVYNGVGQIVQYSDLADIGTVHLGTGYAYLEWFGGQAGAGTSTDNSLAWQASLRHGKIYLLSMTGVYNVPTAAYTASADVEIAGQVPVGVVGRAVDTAYPSTLRLSGAVTTITGSLNLTSVKIDGYGPLSCTGLTTDNAVISHAVAVSTGLETATDTMTIEPQYVTVGGNGKILVSGDLSMWANETLSGVFGLTGVAYNGSLYVAVGAAGAIYTSEDTDTWTVRTSSTTKNFTKVIWSQNKFVAVGAAGLLSYSADGITWTTSTLGTFDIYDVVWFGAANLWVIGGSGGTVQVSADLSVWAARTITGLTGIIYSVGASDTTVVVAGAGVIYSSTDAGTWYSRLSPTVSPLMTTRYSSTKKLWVSGTANGKIITSPDGITWTLASMNVTLTDSIQCQTEANGTLVFGCTSGYILTTYDCSTYTLTQPINAAANYGIASRTGRVITIGAAGAIAESTDLSTWVDQTPVTTEDLVRAKLVNGVYSVLAGGGVYATSRDGSSWTTRSTDQTETLRDLAVNTAKTLYVVVGDAGTILTTTDPAASTVTWTTRTSGTTADLLNVIYFGSAWYVYGAAGTILKSTDGATWTNISATDSAISSNGIVSNGTITVYYGDNGTILSTTDGTTYVKRTSGTTVNLLSGAFGAGIFVLVGQTGTVLTSTDGVLWTNRTSSTSAQLNHVEFAASSFVAVGTLATAIKSTDGISWSNAIGSINGAAPTGTNELKSVKYFDAWYVCGSGGYLIYGSDLWSWSTILSLSPSHEWVDLIGSNATGLWAIGVYTADGWINATSNWGDPRWFPVPFTLPAGKALRKSFQDLIVGDNGTMYKVTGGAYHDALGPTFPALIITPLSPDTTADLIGGTKIGTKYVAISSTSTITSMDEVNWTTGMTAPTGDIVSVSVVGTKIYLLVDGKVLSTADNLVFAKEYDAVANAMELINTKLYLLEDASVVESSATGGVISFVRTKINSGSYKLISAGEIKINGALLTYYLADTGSVLVGSESGLTLLASGEATIMNSLIDVNIANEIAGTVSASKLISASYIGVMDDSTVSAMTGTLSGNVSRCKIDTYSSIGINADISIVDTELTQHTDGYDLLTLGASVKDVTLTNCTTSTKGLLVYSTDTDLIINLYGGFVDSAYSLTNGYAKIYLNSVSNLAGGAYTDSSAYSINGTLFAGIQLAPAENVTSSVSGWHHQSIANVSADTDYLVVGPAAIPLAAGSESVYTLRYAKASAAMKLLYELGGRIRLDVELPAGYDKKEQAKIKLRPVLYTSGSTIVAHVTIISSRQFSLSANNTGLSCIGSSYSGSTTDAAKLGNTSYLWSGRRETLMGDPGTSGIPLKAWYFDGFGDRTNDMYIQTGGSRDIPGIVKYTDTGASAADNVLNYLPYITIEAEESCTLPIGTKIKLTLDPALPQIEAFTTWLGETVDATLDTVQNQEFRLLNLVDINTEEIKLRTVRNIASALVDEQVYLGIAYNYSYGGATWYQNPDPGYIFPGMSALGKNVRLTIEGLASNPPSAFVGTNYDMFTTGHYRQTSDTAYKLTAEMLPKNYLPT